MSSTSSPIDATLDSALHLDGHSAQEGSEISPLPSPSASAFLRTAATLDGLARQLVDLKDTTGSEGEEIRCCCGATAGCATWLQRDRMEDKLKLSGEIGDALLQRYEALESKVQAYEKQLEAKKTALAESLRRVNNLEKANTTHLARYAEISKKNEALEKRYTQALHTQTLTQQSLTHVRSELTALRSKGQRHVAKGSNANLEARLMDAETRYDDMRDNAEAEERNAKDEARRRKRAEARIEELTAQLALREKEIEDVKHARTRDAQDLLANAKERLEVLHTELSETFRADSPADAPEYQKTLEDLVASNALLKHDASELSMLLNDSREEVQALKEEIEQSRGGLSPGLAPPELMPSSRRLASELLRYHTRTESSPNVGNSIGRSSWARMSVHIPSSSRTWEKEREHARRTSLAPSFASSSSNVDGLTSPGLGMGHIGEYGGTLVSDGPSPGLESPKQIFRSSPNGGIGYVLNGVPKNKSTLPRPPVRRSVSDNRPRPIRTYSPNRPDFIPEWERNDVEATSPQVDEPLSPGGSEYFRSAEASRKRRSIALYRTSTREDGEFSPAAASTLVDQSFGPFLASPISEGGTSPREAKPVHRRTLLLLTKSVGVQTDPVAEDGPTHRDIGFGSDGMEARAISSANESPASFPQPSGDGSETSSLHELKLQGGSGILIVLIEHLTKIMTKLRSADIPTLNRRLRKQHLPGDVAHLSQTTLRNLQQEVAELRSSFRGVQEIPIVNRKELTLLLKLLKDVFGELIELQAVVNDVTIDPSLAKKLQKEAYKDEEEESKGKQAGGLGWIAAPITKFFVTPAQEPEGDAATEESSRASAIARNDKRKPQPATVRAPKLQASTSATTTHISVEFGGAGIVRRAAPAQVAAGGSSGVADILPTSPVLVQAASASTAQPAGDNLAPPNSNPGASLRRQKSRANRSELLGIFAGASSSSRPISPTPWAGAPSAPGISPIPQRQLRAASSQYFGDKTVKNSDATSRKKLSAAVDAVIDRTADQLDESDPHTASSYEPPLLERTLRPRGLSDSSIRSTFITHELNPSDVSASQVGSSYAKGYFGNFASRFYPFRSTADDSAIQADEKPEPAPAPVAVSPQLRDTLTVTVDAPSPARPIAVSPRQQTGELGVVSPRGSVPLGQSLLGKLASSIAAVAEVDDENGDGDDELRAGRMRRTVSRSGAPRAGWR